MITSISHSPEGYPYVQWEAKLVSGNKGCRRIISNFLIFVIGAPLVASIYDFIDGWNAPYTTGTCLIVGLVIWYKSIPEQMNSLSTDPPEPLFRKVHGFARVTMNRAGRLVFEWSSETQEMLVPLEQLTSFELGKWDEWYADVVTEKKFHNYLVIIFNARNGVETVAIHCGSRADILALHTCLTREFIIDRAKFTGNKAASLGGSPPASGKRAAVGRRRYQTARQAAHQVLRRGQHLAANPRLFSSAPRCAMPPRSATPQGAVAERGHGRTSLTLLPVS